MINEKWTDIYASRQSNKILTSILNAIEKVRINGEIKECAVVFYNDVKVIIPFEEMGLPREDRTIVRSMVGAEIDFIVRGIDTEKEIAVASRKFAMELRKRLELPKHKVGDIIQVRVDAVGKNDVIVEAYGIETRIPKDEVDYGYIKSLNDYVQVGDKVQAKIMELDIEKSVIKLSIKETKDDPLKGIGTRYKTNGEYLATVTGMDYFGVYANLEQGVDVLCMLPNWSNFNVNKGDKVLVRILKVDKRAKKAIARLVRVVKRAV